MTPTALYIHIPFCRSKCAYCDFVSFPGALDWLPDYLQALQAEMLLYAGEYGRLSIHSVFLGGGTPSLLSGPQVEALLTAVRGAFALSPQAEITLEANPGTLSLPTLRLYREAGVGRLSLGAQTSQEALLTALGRIHCWTDVEQAVGWAREAGFDNLSLDLIFGLPGERLSDWEQTLTRALALSPQHLSCYSLILEEGTPLERRVRAGELALPAEEEERAMYALALDRLGAEGLEQYELSNFARPGHACRHNLVYWRREPYLGLGVAAHSLMGEVRWGNTESLEEYLHAIQAGKRPRQDVHSLSALERIEEALMLGLRLTRGLDKAAFQQETGESADQLWSAGIAALTGLGLLVNTPTHLRLTRRGMDLHGQVVRRLLC